MAPFSDSDDTRSPAPDDVSDHRHVEKAGRALRVDQIDREERGAMYRPLVISSDTDDLTARQNPPIEEISRNVSIGESQVGFAAATHLSGGSFRHIPPDAQERSPPGQALDEVHIHIGRIEVSAVTPAASPATPARRTMNLDEYLARRDGRRS